MYTQQQMAPISQPQKPTIQKLLDDNSHLISLIVDLQSKGRQMETIEYQRTLHRNLTYLTQFDMTQSHHPSTLPPPDAFMQQQQQTQQPPMMSSNMMQPSQMTVSAANSEQVYRPQTNSPAPSNVPLPTLNKSPHGSTSTAGSLYPPSATSTVAPPLQQQRSPVGSASSPSGPVPSSISPQNPSMNKAPTPQPASSHLPSMSQQQPQPPPRPYLPSQQMMQQQGRVMNGTAMDHASAAQTQPSYMQGQQSYVPQPQHPYSAQQNGYGHHSNSNMPQQHYSMYHSQQNPSMSMPPNQMNKPNSPVNNQQQSIIPAPSSPKPSSSSSPSQPTNTQNLVSNPQQQQQMAYSNYGGQQQQMYHPQQQTYHMPQQQQQWQNQPPRMMMQPQYSQYQQGQYQQAPPQS